MNQIPLVGRLHHRLAVAAAQHPWLRTPLGLIVLLLQRTPAEQVADQCEYVTEVGVGSALRSAFGLSALGALNSLAGATPSTTTTTTTTSGGTTTTTTVSTVNFNVSAATPSSGPIGSAFSIEAAVGSPVSVGVTLTGYVTNPKSWSVSGTLPDGLSINGGNPLNVTAPGKLTISGTPTKPGVWTVTATAYDGANETGYANSCDIAFSVGSSASVVAPSITAQPVDSQGLLGGSVTLNATVSGTTPAYTWYHNSILMAGITTSSLTLSNLQASDAGSYYLTATNTQGSVTSNTVKVTVDSAVVAPAIVTQPLSVSVTEGDSVTITASVSGTAPLSYLWAKNGVAIPNTNSTSFTLSAAQAGDAGNYSLAATNTAGTATSNQATITVLGAAVAPTITAQPQSLTATVGGPASFSVTLGTAGAATYQWSKDAVALPASNASTYTIPVVHSTDAGNYTVKATTAYGSVTSASATLSVTDANTSPTITTQPQSASVPAGNSVVFTAAASGTSPLAYQWSLNGNPLSGANSASLTLASIQSGDAGSYALTVTNSYGSATSKVATLTIAAGGGTATAPSFVRQPASDSVAVGHSLSFSAATSSTSTTSYQWQVSTNNGSTWSKLTDNGTYSGTSSSTLSITAVASGMNGYQYELVATNTSGANASSAITLTVSNPPFPSPSGIAIDSSGNLFIDDTTTNTIQFVTPAGSASLLAGAQGQQGATNATGASALFRQPTAVALDKSENLFVADTGNSLIRKITPAGVVTTFAGSPDYQGYFDGTGGAAMFNAPQGIAVDASGNVYVADTGNSAIRIISVDGVVSTYAGNGQTGSADGHNYQARFNQPSGLAIDKSGNLYVADTANDTIRKIAADGTVSTLAGMPGISGYEDGAGATALLNHPTGLALDSAGNLYVADTGNETIRVITPPGVVSTLAGLPTVAGLLDGSGANAWFNQPKNLAVDASGNVYVTDAANAAIRKVTTTGIVSTFIVTTTNTTATVPSSTGSTTTGTSSGTGSSSSGSGGGGAMEPGFLVALAALAGLRRASTRNRS